MKNKNDRNCTILSTVPVYDMISTITACIHSDRIKCACRISLGAVPTPLKPHFLANVSVVEITKGYSSMKIIGV